MQSNENQIAYRSSRTVALKWLKRAVIALFALVAVAAATVFIRGDSWSKMKERAAAQGQVDYYTQRQGPDGPSTLTSRRAQVWLLIHQKFPAAARRENKRYLADLERLPEKDSFNISNERFLTACEFRSAGFLDIAIEEFSTLEAEDGYSYGGLNTSQFVIITLMEKKSYAEAEAKCQQILNSPEKLKLLRQYKLWNPWELVAKCLAAQEKHAEAEPAFRRAIAASVETRGLDDFGTNYLRVHFAHSLEAIGRNEEAWALARQALPGLENFKYSGYESIRKLREFIARLERSVKPSDGPIEPVGGSKKPFQALFAKRKKTRCFHRADLKVC